MDQLLWLAEHPDLSAAIGEVKREPDPLARLEATTRLANYRRDFTLATRLDRLASEGLQAVTNGEASVAGLQPLRIALLASHTVDHLVPAIRVAGLQRGLAL
ncbi:MAG: methoxymalonyl-ACP biosynthesis protein, partial [Pseudomonas stutzeri]|nr:methoxymalonyl-ACP biosynthesis protein [Stutzerimonas stutzeri]